MLAANPRFKIVYLFPHPQQRLDEASPFGWYTPGILATAHPMLKSCVLPADLREAHSDLDDVLVNRLTGAIWPLLLPVQIDSLAPSLDIMESDFVVCVTTNAEVAAVTDQILQARKIPILHISSIAGSGRTPLQNFSLASVCTHVRKVLNALALEPTQEQFVRVCRRLLSEAPQRKLRQHPLRLGMHNVTVPNEVALAAFGYKFHRAKKISKPLSAIGTSPDIYVTRICQAADAVAKERARLLTGHSAQLQDNRAVIAVASSYARFYRVWKDFVQRVPSDKRRDLRHALAMVFRSTSYFHPITLDEVGKPEFGPIGILVSQQLSDDMRAFTAALAMLSSATLCPVLRLEPKLNQVRGDSAELARCVRVNAGPNYAWKQARMMRMMGQKMRSLIHPDFLTRIEAKETGRIEGLKLITDLPLELMPSNGMPLGLRFDVSRISPVPGNLFWQCCNQTPIHVPAYVFYEVLVVRSFKKTDPIRRILEQAFQVISAPGNLKNVKYHFVDVETQQQFVDAVNSFQGAIMIFDGHGRYDANLGIGQLIVGGVPLDTWALKRVCQLPPVVMFSASDTQPIEGSHGSVATAAFALGARAVLATMFPIQAQHSSIMMARMLLRLDQFVPLAKSIFPVLTWRHVVSGMLRMSHTTEAARALNTRAQLALTEEALSRVQMAANVEINYLRPNWYDGWIDALAKEANRTSDEIRTLLGKHVGLTDAMKYVQLGNPERVFIY